MLHEKIAVEAKNFNGLIQALMPKTSNELTFTIIAQQIAPMMLIQPKKYKEAFLVYSSFKNSISFILRNGKLEEPKLDWNKIHYETGIFVTESKK